jgi:hypothetical protein
MSLYPFGTCYETRSRKHAPKVTHTDARAPMGPGPHAWRVWIEIHTRWTSAPNAQKHLRPFTPKESQFSNRRIRTLLKLLRLLHLGATRAQASLNNYPRSPRGKWRWGWPSSLHLHSITLTLLKVLWVLVGPIFPHNIIRIHNTVTWDRQYSKEYSSHSGMNVRNILYNIVDPT